MAYTFGEDFLEDLRRRCSIENVVGRYVELKKSGSSLVGLCPFHSERTPSFHVTPSKQMFYCFGCNTGGDVITFIMAIEHLSYIDAVQFLADSVGIPVPRRDVLDSELSALRKKMLEMNRIAARFFFNTLTSPEGKIAMDYLLDRQLKPQTIKRFGLGWAPNSWDSLIRFMTAQGFSANDLKASGLVSDSGGKIFDRFRGRVMYPIIDHKNNVIGFGGRTLEKDAPAKYLNTAENLVYKKGQNLYALHYAKNSRRKDIILCEGYMDVISLHQNGFDNAVASCGTALTPDQARLLRRYTEDVILCYDSDEAGKKATKRALDILPSADLRVRVITVDGGKDPDELMKTEDGKEKFSRLLDGSLSAIDYSLERVRDKYNLTIETEKIQCIKESVGILATLRSAIDTEVYLGKVSNDLNISKDALQAELKKQKKRLADAQNQAQKKKMLSDLRDVNDRINPQRGQHLRAAKAEEDLIALLIHSPEFLTKTEEAIGPEDFVTDFNRRVYSVVTDKLKQSPTQDISLADSFTPEEISHIELFIRKTGALEVSPQAFEDILRTIREEKQRVLQRAFLTDEAFDAQLQALRGRRKNEQQ